MRQEGDDEARLARDFDHAAAAQLALLLEIVETDAEQRDAFVQDPRQLADAHPDLEADRFQDVLEVLAGCTPEERAFLLDLNARWPLRIDVPGRMTSCLVF